MTRTHVGATSGSAGAALAELFSGGPTDPYPLYNELRESGDGVHYCELVGGYLVFRYDDVSRMGREHEVFSSNFFDQGPMGIHDPGDPEHRRFINFSRRLMAFNDPPHHTMLRRIIQHGFTAKAALRWQRVIEDAVENLLGRFAPGDHIDFVSQLSSDVPIDTICAVMGLPVYSRDAIRASSSGFQETLEPFILGGQRDNAIRRALQLFDEVAGVIEERRVRPTGDLISVVVEATSRENEQVEPEDVLAQLVFLLAAGNETTVNLLTNGVHLLVENGSWYQRLQHERRLLKFFLDEALRLRPPIHLDPRMTVVPTTLGDTELPPGTLVFQVLAAANRDPRKFDDPDSFRLDRGRAQHLSFNTGVHRCVGAPLAKLEGEIFFDRFLDRFPSFSLGPGGARMRTNHAEGRVLESLAVIL